MTKKNWIPYFNTSGFNFDTERINLTIDMAPNKWVRKIISVD
ncbi:MAG: hypothetical protein P8H34_03385 [Flavobacteriaceae bacterium]|nr:hypothetical protein [Flavobacteriaceae bacterium]MDG1790471.1 hypothetical protein [Flavobacteriaceae bacterium]MDG2447365.1 hypothetical protein [Flavobacteriaceae bacterium]